MLHILKLLQRDASFEKQYCNFISAEIPIHVLNSSACKSKPIVEPRPHLRTHPGQCVPIVHSFFFFWHCWLHFQKACVKSPYSNVFHADTFGGLLSSKKTEQPNTKQWTISREEKNPPSLIQLARHTHLDNLDWTWLSGRGSLQESCSLYM